MNLRIEQILPLWGADGEDAGLLTGVRIGYYRQLVRGDWYTLPFGRSGNWLREIDKGARKRSGQPRLEGAPTSRYTASAA